MKFSLFIHFTFVSLVILSLGCQAKKNKGGLVENPFNQSYEPPPSLPREKPEVMAQRMYEADAQEAAKVGPWFLKDWLEKGQVRVLDLTPRDERVKFGNLQGFVKWDGERPLSWSKTKTLVLASTSRHQAAMGRLQKQLTKQGYQEVYVLDGGLEAWVKIFGNR